MSAQKSSSGGDARGGIWDVSVDNYKQPDRNETGQTDSVNDGQGIDSIGAGGEPIAGGFPTANVFPHEVIQVDDTKIKVRYGQVANIDTSGTNPDISLATEYTVVDGDRIFIKVTVDESTAQPEDAEIYVSTSVPSDSAGTAYLQLAQVVVEDEKITNIAQTASGSFYMLSCASVHIFSKI